MPVINLETKFEIGDVAVFKTDPGKLKWLVIGIMLTPNGIVYELGLGVDRAEAFGIELEHYKQKEVNG